jgi:hypothetical protein
MEDILKKIALCVERGKIAREFPHPVELAGQDGVDELTKQALESGVHPGEILSQGLIAGMNKVGELFQAGDVFLSDVLVSARALSMGMIHLKPYFHSGAVKHRGYTKAPFVSPALYQEFIFPYHRRVADFVHSYDLPFIMHSCGKIRPLLPKIVEAGVDGLQALEAKAGQHVVEMAEATGNKIAFMGNLDIRAFEANDPKTLEAEIIPKLRAIKEKRIPYVFFSDHAIPKSVKLETYRYALELHNKYGRY